VVSPQNYNSCLVHDYVVLAVNNLALTEENRRVNFGRGDGVWANNSPYTAPQEQRDTYHANIMVNRPPLIGVYANSKTNPFLKASLESPRIVAPTGRSVRAYQKILRLFEEMFGVESFNRVCIFRTTTWKSRMLVSRRRGGPFHQ
jgi:hypothetical protein